MARLADGVVVGSALVRRIAEAESPAQAVAEAATLTRSLVAATRGGIGA